MKIGNLEISGFAALAPMAGVADRAMREICRKHGAAFTVGELTSAKGVSLGDKKSEALLSIGEIGILRTISLRPFLVFSEMQVIYCPSYSAVFNSPTRIPVYINSNRALFP